jgi:arylsulfatase A-like enzyme
VTGSRTVAAAWLAAGLALAGCRPGETFTDVFSDLEAGAFVAATDVAQLKDEGRGEWLGDAYWQPLPIVPLEGWGLANANGWRPLGGRSTLRLWRRSAGSAGLALALRRLPPGTSDAPAGPLDLEVGWNGTALGRVEVGIGQTAAVLAIPDAGLRDVNDVELRFDPPFRQRFGGPQAIALERFGLVPATAAPAGGTAGAEIDRELGVLRIAGDGSFVTPLDLPRDAVRLELELRWSGGPGTLRVLAVEAGGERHELVVARGSAGGAWTPLAAPLDGLAGGRVALVFKTRLTGRLEIRAPCLVAKPAAAAAEAPAAARPDGPLPDIVVIVLDAARGDRFPPYEYPRETTPRITAMAADALAFRHAYSECPSTNCSIPDLLSGISFLAPGQGRISRLDDRVRTLPEYLQEVGYRTVGFSANPFNTSSRRLNQGFDEFHQLWGRHPDRGPYGMARLAAEEIAAREPGAPLFLMLHLLLPHEPYAPLPEFDVFGDPDYAGKIGPGSDVSPYRAGREALADADAERFVDLYDGNLLMADDAVGRVFDAMREAGRWHNSLVLVTADHGEAFWEHGRMGHNATLFDEMLHVPFLLRLPGGRVPAGVDLDQPVILSDAVPTLLARVGLEPAPEVGGRDLLAIDHGPQPRILFHRTSNKDRPTFAVRTPRCLVVVRPDLQQQSLFDLASDPGETRNLVGERPLLYAGLTLRLRRHRAAAAALAFTAEEAQLSDEDLEELRSLGYLQ